VTVFIVAIPGPLAQYLAGQLKAANLFAVVGCSGAFTTERALIGTGLRAASNDISLFTGALAEAILRPGTAPVATATHPVLAEHCRTPLDLAASLLVLSGNLPHGTKVALGRARLASMWRQFPDLHIKTVKKMTPVIEALRGVVVDYTNDDVEKHFAKFEGRTDVARLSFMPTYLGGYEKLWGPIEAMFEWEPPTCPPLDDDRKDRIVAAMRDAGNYIHLDDNEERGKRLGLRLAVRYDRALKRSMFIYSDFVAPWQCTDEAIRKQEPVKMATTFDVGDEVGVCTLTQPQAVYIRELLTAVKIDKSYSVDNGVIADFGVVTPKGVIGAFGLCNMRFAGMCDRRGYLLYDIAAPGLNARLAKLIVLVSLSKEVRRASQIILRNPRLEVVDTTAFTDKPVSMKYRGVMELTSRNEEQHFLQYRGETGKLSIREATDLWRTKYAR
jgi:hypothetical protein